jgi:uncharacterized membrane protein YbhN (UPF0104 family)
MNSTSAVQKRGIYWQSLVRWAIAFLVAGLAAWLSARHIQWAELGAALAHPHWLLLAAALATVLATTAGKAARWLVLLRHSGTRASPARVVRVLLIGQMGNSFLPARIGDVARAVLLGPQSAAGVPAVLGTVVVEKALDGLVGLLMLAGLALGTPLPAWLRQSIFGFTLLTGLLLALLILAAVRREWAARTVRSLFRFLPAGLRARAESLLVRFGQGLGLLRSPGDALLALAWPLRPTWWPSPPWISRRPCGAPGSCWRQSMSPTFCPPSPARSACSNTLASSRWRRWGWVGSRRWPLASCSTCWSTARRRSLARRAWSPRA